MKKKIVSVRKVLLGSVALAGKVSWVALVDSFPANAPLPPAPRGARGARASHAARAPRARFFHKKHNLHLARKIARNLKGDFLMECRETVRRRRILL